MVSQRGELGKLPKFWYEYTSVSGYHKYFDTIYIYILHLFYLLKTEFCGNDTKGEGVWEVKTNYFFIELYMYYCQMANEIIDLFK